MRECVVIGGGLGGLFTGALLSKNGYRVTVLEKNAVIGGGLQTFRRKGLVFETGMHILGGLQPGGSIYKICLYLGILERIQLKNVDFDCIDSITYLSDGKTYRIPQGRDHFVTYLSREFPDEASGIRAYVDALYRLTEEVDLFYLRKGKDGIFSHSEQFLWAADELIAYYVGDSRLRDVLAYMNPMYGGVAGHTPAYIHALINVLYIEGPSRFVGGSQQMADALAEVIRDAGGQVVANAEVSRIRVSERMVTAVETRDGTEYRADVYISAAHPCQTVALCDTGAFPKSYRSRLEEIPNSYSAFTLYIIFRKNTFPYINHTCYYQDDYGLVWRHGEYDEDVWPRGFMYMTPPEAGQGRYANKMIVNCIMPFGVVRRWENTTVGRRGADYEAWKERHVEKVLSRLERLHPGFREMVDAVYASSPLTIRDYYHEKEGALYGVRKDCRNIALSQIPIYTKVRNLLLTGQNINLHGICGVPLTAINTAEALLGENQLVNQINACYEEETSR